MTDKENQHYIPKFYLRKFSIENNLKQIGLFNTKNEKFVKSAKLKTQACIPYFYGEDGELEDFLATTESHHARLLTKIIEENYLPLQNTREHVELVSFLMLTELRNPKNSEYVKGSFLKLRKLLAQKGEKFVEAIPENLFSELDAVEMSIARLHFAIEICGDLKYKLVINESPLPFITSDNPLVKYNLLMELNHYNRGSAGLGNIGIKIFFPISPSKILILYDPWCYKIGSYKTKIIKTKEIQDIEQINFLQYLNCNDTIYFNESFIEHKARRQFEKSLNYEKANLPQVKEVKEIDANGKVKENSFMIMNSVSECRTKLQLSFIKLTDNAKFLKVDHRTAQIRPFALEIRDKYRN